MDEALWRRRQLLLPLTQEALRNITSERYTRAEDWEGWWKRYGKKFKPKDDDDE
jgi:hypothetical protein